MADKQSKRNAEAYLKQIPYYGEFLSPMTLQTIKEAHIAGAHSRDEEIEDLEFRLRDKKADIQFLESRIAELKNPWIKPSEQMPVDGDDIVYLLYEGDAGRMKYHNTYEKWLRESVTHWMKVTLKEE